MHTIKESIFPNRLLRKLAKAEIAYTLTQAREIVERVSPLVYGQLSIRQFRRDLFTGVLDPYLEPEEREALDAAYGLEEAVLEQFADMIGDLANGYSYKVHMDNDDLRQEGSQAVILAMYGYDGQCEMSTYFRFAIQRRMEDICRFDKRRPQCSLDDDIDIADDQKDDEEVVGDIDLMRKAMVVVQAELTPLERVVLELYSHEGHGCLSKAARRLINPKTLKPYTRASASYALKSVLDKLTRAYDNLLLNTHRRVA